MDDRPYDDDPDRLRDRLRDAPPGDWFVFETVAAGGSLAVGRACGNPDPSLVLVVYEGLSEPVAEAAARGLAPWPRDQGRSIVLPEQ